MLALERGRILPNIHFSKPNPKSKDRPIPNISTKTYLIVVPFEKCGLKVPTDTLTWPKNRAERIGVNRYATMPLQMGEANLVEIQFWYRRSQCSCEYFIQAQTIQLTYFRFSWTPHRKWVLKSPQNLLLSRKTTIYSPSQPLPPMP